MRKLLGLYICKLIYIYLYCSFYKLLKNTFSILKYIGRFEFVFSHYQSEHWCEVDDNITISHSESADSTLCWTNFLDEANLSSVKFDIHSHSKLSFIRLWIATISNFRCSKWPLLNKIIKTETSTIMVQIPSNKI